MTTFEIFQAAFGSGILILVIGIAVAMGRLFQKVDSAISEIKEVKEEIKELKKGIQSLDSSLSHLEGRFEERGYWQSKKIGGEK